MMMDVEHDLSRFLWVLIKIGLQYENYELHRRVIVIEQQNAIHAGALGLRAGARDDGRPVAGIVDLARLARGDRYDAKNLGRSQLRGGRRWAARASRRKQPARKKRDASPKATDHQIRFADHVTLSSKKDERRAGSSVTTASTAKLIR
jgi:hypothetical protein